MRACEGRNSVLQFYFSLSDEQEVAEGFAGRNMFSVFSGNLPLYVAASWGGLGRRASGQGQDTWPSAWPPLLSLGWHSSPGSPAETQKQTRQLTLRKQGLFFVVASSFSFFFFLNSAVWCIFRRFKARVEQLFMWQALIYGHLRIPKMLLLLQKHTFPQCSHKQAHFILRKYWNCTTKSSKLWRWLVGTGVSLC